MARYATLAAVTSFPLTLDAGTPPSKVADLIIANWRDRLEAVVHLDPDLIVMPEHCDRPFVGTYPPELMMEYYAQREDRVRDFLATVAVKHRTNIVYSGLREEAGSRYNSSQVIDRSGAVTGVYDKCFLTPGEHEQLTPGSAPRLIELDFGTVAPAICFDLNFQELVPRYAALCPDVVAFSSNFHGGYLQSHWAYSARAFFVGAICPPSRSAILDRTGAEVATSTNYSPHTLARVNLDSALVHLDGNRSTFDEIRRRYRTDVRIQDPGLIGVVQLSAESHGLSVDEVIEEFELERLNDYLARARRLRGREE